ncbi:MAG TPA: NfeD family protein [Gaiellaceae bacterium]|nr:NfeD family protein [Gaiellaceae bacterium]
MFFVLAFVLLIVLSSPWNIVGFGTCFILGIGELVFWSRRVRGRPVAVGAHTLLGREAQVISPCRPEGQVQLDGEIWQARCADGADPGESVRVVARERLVLVVERVYGGGGGT